MMMNIKRRISLLPFDENELKKEDRLLEKELEDLEIL